MKKVEKIRLLLKHQKQIIEGLFVSLITGWVLTSIIRGTYRQIENLQFAAEGNFVLTLLIITVFTLLFGFLYYKYSDVARILMFSLVYIYVILCAFNSNQVGWAGMASNPIGNVCFQGVLCFIAVLAFLYVKDDIFKTLEQFRMTKKQRNIFVIIVGVLLFAFVGVVTVYRYLSYGNSTYDFGIFAQMYENMRQTGAISTTVERNTLLSHFGVHFSPIFYIGLPIYFIFPSPVTVQLIQALMVALPVIPIVLIAKKYNLYNKMIVALVLLYALYPATAGGTFYDIHENCFLVFFLLMTVWAVEKKKNVLMPVMMLLSLFVKEDAAIYILILGVFYIFSRKDKKRGAILVAVSAIYFVIAVMIVNSYGLGIMDDRFENLFFDPQSGMGQIIQTIINNPAYVIGQIISNVKATGDVFNMDKIEYILYMFIPMAPVIFTTGKKYSRYILLAPLIVINLFTVYRYMHDITFQYNFGIIALMVYLVIMNMADREHKKAKTYMSVAVICAGIMFVGAILPKMNDYTARYRENKATYEKMNVAISAVPESASVCASGYLIPHLSKHLEMYDQRYLNEPKYTDYLVIDERSTDEKQKFDEVLASGKYDLVYREENLISIYRINENK